MRYLFVHQNFPGQFVHIVRHTLARKANDVVFISEPNPNVIAGVRKAVYKVPRPPSPTTHRIAVEFEATTLRAEAVGRTAASLRRLGFTPDIIIGHHGWGELLDIRDVWPHAPLLGYYEFYYRLEGQDVGFDPEFPTDTSDFPRIRAKNAVNLLALDLGGHGQTPTAWQRSTYPDWAQDQITLLREGVNLKLCAPDPTARRRPFALDALTIAPAEKLVTYVARDLEPYRGFHILMRALPDLLAARSDVRVIIVGADGVSYGVPPRQGTWRETLLAELGGRIDLNRVHFVGRLDYASFIRVLQRSDAHVYLTYPFVASWSLREALAIGCPIIGSATPTVEEFIKDGSNGVLAPFHDPKALARRVLDVLASPALTRRIRVGARRYAETHLDLADHLKAYDALITRLVK